MKATIYHNPMCGTSRKTLEILRFRGQRVDSRISRKSPDPRGTEATVRTRRDHTARRLAPKEPLARELGLTRTDVSDDEVLDAMVAQPILIERPLVKTGKGVRLCTQDVVRENLVEFMSRKWCCRPSGGHCTSRVCPFRSKKGHIHGMSRLDPRLLLQGYATGVFPMADSRDVRMSFLGGAAQSSDHAARSIPMSRSLRRDDPFGKFAVTHDRAFGKVIAACAERDETWINTALEHAMLALTARVMPIRSRCGTAMTSPAGSTE